MRGVIEIAMLAEPALGSARSCVGRADSADVHPDEPFAASRALEESGARRVSRGVAVVQPDVPALEGPCERRRQAPLVAGRSDATAGGLYAAKAFGHVRVESDHAQRTPAPRIVAGWRSDRRGLGACDRCRQLEHHPVIRDVVLASVGPLGSCGDDPSHAHLLVALVHEVTSDSKAIVGERNAELPLAVQDVSGRQDAQGGDQHTGPLESSGAVRIEEPDAREAPARSSAMRPALVLPEDRRFGSVRDRGGRGQPADQRGGEGGGCEAP